MAYVLLLSAFTAVVIGSLEATPLFNNAFSNNAASFSDAFGRLRTQAEQFPWSQTFDQLHQNLQNRLNQVQWPSVPNTDFFQNSQNQWPSVPNTDFFQNSQNQWPSAANTGLFSSGFGSDFLGGFFGGR
ncbi:hypothetical protein BsWGS_18595 [Bradybaena similaris]